MDKYKYICPRCGALISHPKNEIHYCRFCKTQLLETKYTQEEYAKHISDGTIEDCEAQIFNEYVKDNPLYDPDEETRSYLKLQAIRQHNEAQYRQERQAKENSKPHCPNCNSTNICKITTGNRIASGAVFGIFSSNIGKTMRCRDCGYKW